MKHGEEGEGDAGEDGLGAEFGAAFLAGHGELQDAEGAGEDLRGGDELVGDFVIADGGRFGGRDEPRGIGDFQDTLEADFEAQGVGGFPILGGAGGDAGGGLGLLVIVLVQFDERLFHGRRRALFVAAGHHAAVFERVGELGVRGGGRTEPGPAGAEADDRRREAAAALKGCAERRIAADFAQAESFEFGVDIPQAFENFAAERFGVGAFDGAGDNHAQVAAEGGAGDDAEHALHALEEKLETRGLEGFGLCAFGSGPALAAQHALEGLEDVREVGAECAGFGLEHHHGVVVAGRGGHEGIPAGGFFFEHQHEALEGGVFFADVDVELLGDVLSFKGEQPGERVDVRAFDETDDVGELAGEVLDGRFVLRDQRAGGVAEFCGEDAEVDVGGRPGGGRDGAGDFVPAGEFGGGDGFERRGAEEGVVRKRFGPDFLELVAHVRNGDEDEDDEAELAGVGESNDWDGLIADGSDFGGGRAGREEREDHGAA